MIESLLANEIFLTEIFNTYKSRVLRTSDANTKSFRNGALIFFVLKQLSSFYWTVNDKRIFYK